MASLVPFKSSVGSVGFDNFFDDFFKPFYPLAQAAATSASFRMDVREDEGNYLIDAELPGVKKEEVFISLRDKKLFIEVKHEEETQQEGPSYLHRERMAYAATRSVYLADAKGSDISARLKDGILSVTVPKMQVEDTTYNVEIQ